MKYYAKAIDLKGNKLDLEVYKVTGLLRIGTLLITSLETNAKEIYCSHNALTSLEASNAKWVYCSNNKIIKLYVPNADLVFCYDNDDLAALVKDCGRSERQIWSQKVQGVIYTYIGCRRFTLEEAIEAINEKYSGQEAKEYIEKVILSQSKAV